MADVEKRRDGFTVRVEVEHDDVSIDGMREGIAELLGGKVLARRADAEPGKPGRITAAVIGVQVSVLPPDDERDVRLELLEQMRELELQLLDGTLTSDGRMKLRLLAQCLDVHAALGDGLVGLDEGLRAWLRA
jgi:hypothetical protein